MIRVSDGDGPPLPAFAITVAAPTSNSPPTITGTPATSATQGTAYTFQPDGGGCGRRHAVLHDREPAGVGDVQRDTGRLQGTPSASNVGTYATS